MARTYILWHNDVADVPGLPVGTPMYWLNVNGGTEAEDRALYNSQSASERIAQSNTTQPPSASGWAVTVDNTNPGNGTFVGELDILFPANRPDILAIRVKQVDLVNKRVMYELIASTTSGIFYEFENYPPGTFDFFSKWWPADFIVILKAFQPLGDTITVDDGNGGHVVVARSSSYQGYRYDPVVNTFIIFRAK